MEYDERLRYQILARVILSKGLMTLISCKHRVDMVAKISLTERERVGRGGVAKRDWKNQLPTTYLKRDF